MGPGDRGHGHIIDFPKPEFNFILAGNLFRQVFNVVLSDVPAKKSDLVTGAYEADAPANPTTVAVKIIDMLGEEVLVVKTV